MELTVRRRVSECANIELRQRCRVQNFLATPDSSAIVGVQCEDIGGSAETIPADLVVDASGRGTLTLKLLQSAGLPAPEETSVGIDMTYATSVFSIPDDAPPDWKGVMVFGAAPQDARGGLLMPLEGNRWIVSVGEAHGDGPPGDVDGYLEYVRSLRTPTIYNAIKHARRMGDIVRFRFPESVRRHYERLSSFPRGLLPVGDALCRFNPVYGQGMSVAAKEACLLAQLLRTLGREHDPLAALASAFFDQAQGVLETPWAVASQDFIYPQTRGQRPADLESALRFGNALSRLAAEDASVHKLMVGVQMLLEPRSVFREPELVRRVTAAMAAS